MAVPLRSADDVIADLKRRGYGPGATSEVIAEIDREVCATTPCPECGEAPEYRPFHKGRSYVAFAICGCGFWAEF